MVKDKERKVSVYMYVNFDFVIYIVVICDVRGWKKCYGVINCNGVYMRILLFYMVFCIKKNGVFLGCKWIICKYIFNRKKCVIRIIYWF